MIAMRVRIAVLDDHRLAREGLCALLESRSWLEVVASGPTGEGARAAVAGANPDIVLFDGDDNGVDAVEELAAALESSRFIVLSNQHEYRTCREAMRTGAKGLVWKRQSPSLLMKAIRAVNEGQLWFSRVALAQLLETMRVTPRASDVGGPHSPEQAKIAALTDRELEVINLLKDGFDAVDIAHALEIRPSTVRHHFAAIYRKLGVSNRLELLIYVLKYGVTG